MSGMKANGGCDEEEEEEFIYHRPDSNLIGFLKSKGKPLDNDDDDVSSKDMMVSEVVVIL